MGIVGRVETATPQLRFVRKVVGMGVNHILQQAWLIETHDDDEVLASEYEWRDVPLDNDGPS